MKGHTRSDHPESSAARRAKARRESCPPLVAGGQGRTAQDVADTSAGMLWVLAICGALLALWGVLA